MIPAIDAQIRKLLPQKMFVILDSIYWLSPSLAKAKIGMIPLNLDRPLCIGPETFDLVFNRKPDAALSVRLPQMC